MSVKSWLPIFLLASCLIATPVARAADPAIEQYNQAVSYHNEAFRLLGEKKYAEGNEARARGIAAYLKVIELNPSLFEAYVNLGDLYRKNAPGSQDLLRAVEMYKKALTIRPNDAATFNKLNLVHWDLGNVKDSLAATAQAVRFAPTTPVYVYNLGFQNASLGNFQEARAALGRLRTLDQAMAQKLEKAIQERSGELSLAGRPAVYSNPKIQLVRIEPGSFQMGSSSFAPSGHRAVNLRRGFYIGKFPVTQAQWQAVMGDNPSFFKNCGGDCPVEQVSWHDSQAFVTRLNKLNDGYRYRLPSEAEWEYAYRAGSRESTYGGVDLADLSWHSGNSGAKTHPVGQKPPNGYGIHDMEGLVQEWCMDVHADPGGTPDGGPVLEGADRMIRVMRGNSFYAMNMTPGGTIRRRARVNEVSRNHGFRVAAEKIGAAE